MLQAHFNFCIFTIHTGRDQHIIKRTFYSLDLSNRGWLKSPEHTEIKRQTSSKRNFCTTEFKSESSDNTTANSSASRKNSAPGEAYMERKHNIATDGMSSNRTPEKAGTGTIKQILKDAEGRSRMKETDDDSEATTKKTTEGRRRDGAIKKVDKKPENTIEKTSAGSSRTMVSDNADKADKAVSRAGNTTTCKRNDGELDNDQESVSKAVIKAAKGAAGKAFDKESVSKGRKAKTGKGDMAMAEVNVEPVSRAKKATTDRGNVELVCTIRKITPGEENIELDKAIVEPVSKAKKTTTGRGNKALNKSDVEPVGAIRKSTPLEQNKELDKANVETLSKAKTATRGIENKALAKADVEPVGAVRKATLLEENKELTIANVEPVSKAKKAGRGNKALDKADAELVSTVRKATLGEENIELDKANVEPVSKGNKRRTGGGNKALDKVGVELMSTATTTDAETGILAQEKLTMHLKHAVEKLKLRLRDISPAAEKVNELVNDFIIPVLCKDPAFEGIEILTTGSYYEKVKISKPNEFDIMLKIPCEGLCIKESNVSGGYYTLAINRKPKHPLTKYVENGNISGQKMLNQLRELIKSNILGIKGQQVLEKHHRTPALQDMDITLERKNSTSPAVTILIDENHHKISVDLVLALEVKGSWPSSTSEGMQIETWLGAKVKREHKFKPMYFVAKQLKNSEEVLWRISFSHIEKLILMNHGNAKTCCETKGDKCCRKKCLKLMKYLLEQLNIKGSTNMSHFCSYHAKTALLHSCTLYPKDEDWKPEHIARCFGRYIEYFIKCLEEANLPNFFIPSLNLFSKDFIPKSSLKYLHTKLNEQMNQDYPLFENK